jgi:predicted 3-demethylubiquinone-9 3-methyltransferase (glyoxalase superfamily)
MQKIIPHLWYDREAKEAATFYCSLFQRSGLLHVNEIKDTPSGDAETIDFELEGQRFSAISAGPYFRLNPSVSLMVACSSEEEVNAKWKALAEDGTELMPLGEYPFSKRYGWIQDRYGLSWQLMLTDSGQAGPKITPNLLFSKEACGRAEEAVRYYAGVFEGSEIGLISRYGEGEAESARAKVNYAAFKLCGLDFSAMDNGFDVEFGFNEAFSFLILCKDQEEIDYYWERLSAVPEAEQCGWVKDRFGVSWQIVPDNMNELFYSGSEEEIRRVTQAFLNMKKFDLKELEKARLGMK